MPFLLLKKPNVQCICLFISLTSNPAVYTSGFMLNCKKWADWMITVPYSYLTNINIQAWVPTKRWLFNLWSLCSAFPAQKHLYDVCSCIRLTSALLQCALFFWSGSFLSSWREAPKALRPQEGMFSFTLIHLTAAHATSRRQCVFSTLMFQVLLLRTEMIPQRLCHLHTLLLLHKSPLLTKVLMSYTRQTVVCLMQYKATKVIWYYQRAGNVRWIWNSSILRGEILESSFSLERRLNTSKVTWRWESSILHCTSDICVPYVQT